VAPEIHWNTGNAGRTCLGAGASLHLVRPLGFSLESRQVRRAGLDYWSKVDVTVWDDICDFMEGMKPAPGEVALFSKNGDKPFWSMPSPQRQFLIFGSETHGLPEEMRSSYRHAVYTIPITGDIRSLNLSTAVGIALYESLRKACLG